jgi:hypothetical protein
MARHLPDSYNAKNEYSTFKRIFKKANPLAPDDEDTMQKLFKHWKEDKANAEEKLEKSKIEKGKGRKGGPRLEMNPELIVSSQPMENGQANTTKVKTYRRILQVFAGEQKSV